MKKETKEKILLFFVSCIPAIIMLCIMSIPHDPAVGIVLAILTLISLTIPITYILVLGHLSEEEEKERKMLQENEEYYQKMQNLNKNPGELE